MSRESGVNNNMSNPTPDYKPQAHIANTLRDAFQSLNIDDDLLRIVRPPFFFFCNFKSFKFEFLRAQRSVDFL